MRTLKQMVVKEFFYCVGNRHMELWERQKTIEIIANTYQEACKIFDELVVENGWEYAGVNSRYNGRRSTALLPID